MSYDFNTAPEQEDRSELIPPGTVAKMVMLIRTGDGWGDDPFITQSKTSEAKYLNCEFTISSGKHSKRKFWQNIMLDGVSDMAISISRATLRAILESGRNIHPTDASENAMAGRHINGLDDFNGLEFVGKIGIDKAKPNSGYDDKNKLALVITPDKPEYQTIMNGGEIEGTPVTKPVQQAGFSGGGNSSGAAATPQWAKPAAGASMPVSQQQQAAMPKSQANPAPAWAQ